MSAGEAVALVQAVITQAPSSPEGVERQVPVDTYTTLAGELPEGPLQALVEASGVKNFLPSGNYLLLLGDARSQGTYVVSSGILGSFVLHDDDAFEQCPNYDNSSETVLANGGITDRQELTSVLTAALQGTQSSTPNSSGPSTTLQTMHS